MFSLAPLEPINYLIIGHLTYDLTPSGPRIGGTAAYAGLTAHALGLRVGIVTSWGGELPLGNLKQRSPDVGRGIIVLHLALDAQADVGCGDSSFQLVIDVADICGRQLCIVKPEVVN